MLRRLIIGLAEAINRTYVTAICNERRSLMTLSPGVIRIPVNVFDGLDRSIGIGGGEPPGC